jgi:hypothetical protein
MLVVILVTVAPAIASAQPSTVTPIAPTPTEPAPDVYPRRLVDRPLLLPEGAFELGIPLSFRNDRTSSFDPYARYATPVFELELGIDYRLGDSWSRDAKLTAIYLGGRREIIPCRVPGLGVGTQIAILRPPDEEPGFSPSLFVDYRRKLASVVTIQPHASVGYNYAQIHDDDTDHESSVHQLDGSLGAAVQLQAGSVFAFELGASIGYFHDLAEYGAVGIASHSVQSFSLGVLLSATTNADLRFLYMRSLQSFEFSSDGFVLALNVRKI